MTGSDADGQLLVDTVGAVRVLTLNRPERLNALNRALGHALVTAFAEAEADAEIRALVLTGTGDRAFCAGGDLKEMSEATDGQGSGARVVSQAVAGRPTKPLIAAVNGLALGGGLEIVLACDLAVCTDEATFALPEVRRGVLASAGGLVRLPQIIGLRRALQVTLTGQTIEAQTALDWGLVNEVVSTGDVRERAVALATEIAANAPLSVVASKAVIHDSVRLPSEAEAWAVNDQHYVVVAASADAQEGPRAFAEKRAPIWSGR